jgi:hypothetical protein
VLVTLAMLTDGPEVELTIAATFADVAVDETLAPGYVIRAATVQLLAGPTTEISVYNPQRVVYPYCTPSHRPVHEAAHASKLDAET